MYLTDAPKVRHRITFEAMIRRRAVVEVDLLTDATTEQINEAINEAEKEWLTIELEKAHWTKAEHVELLADGTEGSLLAFEGKL